MGLGIDQPPEQGRDDLLRHIGEMALQTDAILDEIFTNYKNQHLSARLIDAMAYATLNGGKRIRAYLVYGGAGLIKGQENDTSKQGIARVAAAFECLHAYSLIHDDLPAMDDAATRRGKPSCHMAFDEATAILAGDALQTLAFALLAEANTHPDDRIRANLVLELANAAGCAGMAGGQMLDLEAESRSFSHAETMRMQALKTGALITSSVVAGGHFAGAEPATLSHLTSYGQAIGQAFQIADDLLDAEGDEAVVGKPLGQDDWRGKATLVAHLGIKAAKDEAERQVELAKEALGRITHSDPLWHAYLSALADYIITRKA
jgi:farnesyl diphosphate synthase